MLFCSRVIIIEEVMDFQPPVVLKRCTSEKTMRRAEWVHEVWDGRARHVRGTVHCQQAVDPPVPLRRLPHRHRQHLPVLPRIFIGLKSYILHYFHEN